MAHVGIVGAGAAAAAAAFAVDRSVPDVRITVLEATDGVGGRATTRRRDDVVYDYGANYVKSEDPRVSDLLTETLGEELVDVTGPVWTFDREGRVSPGRDADDHKWTCRDGIAGIPRRLFDRTDASVHRETRVEGIAREGGRFGGRARGSDGPGDDAGEVIARDGGRWRLTDAGGTGWGPFDALVLNPPAPGTAGLLRDADWDADVREELARAAADVDYRAVWTAVLGYPFGIDRPYYALVNADKDHAVGWVSREECKPGHVPDGETLLVVQAGAEWSVERAGDPPAENVAALAGHAADLLDDDRLADPDWTDHRDWRNALAESGVSSDLVAAAHAHGLYPVGDWVAGEARVHAALRSGLDAGERIASDLV